MNEQSPLPIPEAALSVLRCAARTAQLLARRQIHLPHENVGKTVRFADGSSARVFRETVLDGAPENPCALVVEFRLRLIHGPRGHALFRRESLLNTPLFVGFPGFVSKLWIAHDEHGVYRGVYEWDGPERAEHYARSLWRVLQIGCDLRSIHYKVLPGVRRDALIASPDQLDALADGASAWWRPIEAA